VDLLSVLFIGYQRRITMSANFCTKCGQPLELPARFCGNCGAPVEDKGQGESAAVFRQMQKPGLAGLGIQAPKLFRGSGARETDTRWGVDTVTLNKLLCCSLMNAPLDMGFLFCHNQETEGKKWIPLHFIESLDELDVEGRAWVRYYFAELEEMGGNYVSDDGRSALAEGVKEAYQETTEDPTCKIDIHICFQPRNEGKIGEEIAGKWTTLADENNLRDVRANLQFPLSGSMMKQRFGDHERWLSQTISDSEDAKRREILTKCLANLRAFVKQIPDGFAHHMQCIAYYADSDNIFDTVLCKEEPETPKRAGLPTRTPQKGLPKPGYEVDLLGNKSAKSLRAHLASEKPFSGNVRRL
jgi:hypothetical protein